MMATRLYEDLKTEYINRQRARIAHCNKLYAAYTSAYSEFLLIRDLHVRLAGQVYNLHDSCDFHTDELKLYRKAMQRARIYVEYTIMSYDIDYVVPCQKSDICSITRERVRDELLCPIHPDLDQFVVTTVHVGKMGNMDMIETKFYPDVFPTFGSMRACTNKMKEIFFRYYPRYSVRPTAFNRVYVPSRIRDIGVLEGDLIFSEAEHAGQMRGELDKTPLGPELQHAVLSFLFPRIMKTLSNSSKLST